MCWNEFPEDHYWNWIGGYFPWLFLEQEFLNDCQTDNSLWKLQEKFYENDPWATMSIINITEGIKTCETNTNPDDYRDPLSHICGWSGVVAEVEWDWTKEDRSDLTGYCPCCKQPFF